MHTHSKKIQPQTFISNKHPDGVYQYLWASVDNDHNQSTNQNRASNSRDSSYQRVPQSGDLIGQCPRH